MNHLLKTDFTLRNILLPLGISFFTFQQLSYIIDSYKGEVPKYGFVQYASFVSYFPQLVAGPIVTHDELVPQFMDESKKHVVWENVAKGSYLFVLGLAKKVLLADIFGNAANWGFANIDALNTTSALITILSYTIQIYFDFSGYCDMAIGIGKMMNIDIPLNFNSPYKAISITDFWDRWHMTLTRFFTKYVYIPLGGSRKGTGRTYLNVLIIFTISGLWHGANWTFVLWGVLHGLFSVIYRRFTPWFDRLPRLINWGITLAFVNATWVIFRADSISQAIQLVYRVLSLNIGSIASGIYSAFMLEEYSLFWTLFPQLRNYPYIFCLLYILISMILILYSKSAYEKMLEFKPSLVKLSYCAVLLVWSVISFSSVSTFLYFNF